jgi:Flp pilus assembly protein TadD
LASARYRRALDAVRLASSLDPGYWYAREATGYVLFRGGKRTEGIGEVETAVHLDPGARQRASLGRMYAQVGRTADARRILQELLGLR